MKDTRQMLFVGTLLAVAIGTCVGIGLYTFAYAKGFSYFRDDPAVCANCHVMQGHLNAWAKGSHKAAASCNSCHTPHNVVGKYLVKAINGFNHSVKFTNEHYPDILQANAMNKWVTEKACRHCHANITHDIDVGRHDEISCVRCHRFVGHDL